MFYPCRVVRSIYVELRSNEMVVVTIFPDRYAAKALRPFAGLGNPVNGDRMRAQNFWNKCGIGIAACGLQPLEEIRHRLRIVTGLVKQLDTDPIRLPLVRTGEVYLALCLNRLYRGERSEPTSLSLVDCNISAVCMPMKPPGTANALMPRASTMKNVKSP